MMTNPAATQPVSFNPAPAGPPSPDDETKSAARDFEAVFLSQMMSHMFEGLETDTLFGGGQGEDMFRSILVQEYGRQMSRGAGIGISDQLQKMMLRMQQQ